MQCDDVAKLLPCSGRTRCCGRGLRAAPHRELSALPGRAGSLPTHAARAPAVAHPLPRAQPRAPRADASPRSRKRASGRRSTRFSPAVGWPTSVPSVARRSPPPRRRRPPCSCTGRGGAGCRSPADLAPGAGGRTTLLTCGTGRFVARPGVGEAAVAARAEHRGHAGARGVLVEPLPAATRRRARRLRHGVRPVDGVDARRRRSRDHPGARSTTTSARSSPTRFPPVRRTPVSGWCTASWADRPPPAS